jgi:Leucine-rich repeat (LRR) protein
MVGFLLFCVVGFFAGAFGQQAPNLITFKTICGNGMSGCTVETNCTLNIRASLGKIRIIEDSTLSNCSKVEELNLQYNKISEISKNAFQGQRNLQELYLYNNQIKVLQPGVFDQLTCLTELRLHKNLIEVIEDSLFSKKREIGIPYLA